MTDAQIAALKAKIDARKATGLTAAEFNAKQKRDAERAARQQALAIQREIAEIVSEGLERRGSSLVCALNRAGLAEIR